MPYARLGYKKLGLKLTEPLDNRPHLTNYPHMVNEVKGDRARDLIKLFL
jgi:hypothetical protein